MFSPKKEGAVFPAGLPPFYVPSFSDPSRACQHSIQTAEPACSITPRRYTDLSEAIQNCQRCQNDDPCRKD